MSEPVMPRCGDTVKHGPSGQEWLVAYADPKRDELSWFGWPEGYAKLSDCTLAERCTDEEHAEFVAQWLDREDAQNSPDMRVRMVRALYRPEEQKRLDEQNRIREIEAAVSVLLGANVPPESIGPIVTHLHERKAALA